MYENNEEVFQISQCYEAKCVYFFWKRMELVIYVQR